MSKMYSSSFCDKAVLDLVAYHGATPPTPPIDGCKMRLFSNSVIPSKGLKVADLTTCVFSGYADSAVLTFNPSVLEDDDSYSKSAQSLLFQATAATPFVGDQIAGVAIIDGATPPNLLYVGVLDTPVQITAADQGLDVVFSINQGGLTAQSEVVPIV